MCNGRSVVLFFILVHIACGVRINFTSCQNPGWHCANHLSTDITYTCSALTNHEYIIHIKDYYTDHIKSLIVQNCKDLRVVLDCPQLQQPSQLQQIKIRNCDKLEFISLSVSSSLQTPPEVIIEDVREIVSLPSNMFKSPTNNNELKCLGTTSLRKIRVAHSKINLINTKAIHNVTGIKNIEFDNVTITNIKSNALEVIANIEDSVFTITDSKILNVESKAITAHVTVATLSGNEFADLVTVAINITSGYLKIIHNKFKDLYEKSITIESVNIDISNNEINTLKRNAMASWKCLRKRAAKTKSYNFAKNIVKKIEPNAFSMDYESCKRSGTNVIISDNKIDCTCRNIAFFTASTFNSALSNAVLNLNSNNTCHSAPCILPVEIVKQLIDNHMCQINLDPEIMCLLYNDKRASTHTMVTDDDVTEPAPTFYLIRQANTVKGGGAMTAVNTAELLRDTKMENKTTISVVFDASQDFADALRNTGNIRKKPIKQKTNVNRCSGNQCRNTVAHDRQKALDFYKYVYAQLRPPKK